MIDYILILSASIGIVSFIYIMFVMIQEQIERKGTALDRFKMFMICWLGASVSLATAIHSIKVMME